MISVVVGLGYGDEGKGLVTDYLCSLSAPGNTIVTRFTGGHQAGHTVQRGDKRHVFSNFGSGTLKGIDTYWSSICTVDPVGIMKEYRKLELLCKIPILYINRQCPIVTPFDKAQNVFKDNFNNHGTCGVGYGTTLEREENYYKLHVYDLNYPNIFKNKVKLIGEYHNWELEETDEFFTAIEFMKSCSNIKFVDQMPKRQHEIYEGSQGLMLDKDLGFFPHVTRGNTGVQNLQLIPDINYETFSISNQVDYYYVTRAYATRHGNGPFEENSELIVFTENAKIETNVDNEYQGRFKKGVLDLEVLNYGFNKMKHYHSSYNPWSRDNLVITCMDHIENYPLNINGTVEYFDKKSFIKRISKSFDTKFDRVYTNNSPEGKLVLNNLER